MIPGAVESFDFQDDLRSKQATLTSPAAYLYQLKEQDHGVAWGRAGEAIVADHAILNTRICISYYTDY